ncbi:MAG: histidine phosphatase family protein [Gallionella sp.]|nr:histidine phosphatase family protein [Gallionella sp.]MDD4947319.1 histidine phosphatase family protein [Gallionella sp.]MDD5612269.1 histidine phosphatase family protein [Gallionella sp.]
MTEIVRPKIVVPHFHGTREKGTRICFIRHGETDWNVVKRIQGQTDIPLNDTGRKQALAMAFNAGHHDFNAIYCSDLMRTVETANALAERRDLKVKTLPLLRERHYGIFQGITAVEGLQRHPEAHACYMARDLNYDFEIGESMLSFETRVKAAVEHLCRHHTGETIVAVTHAGVLDILYRHATGRPLHTPRDFVIPNCALNWFHFDGQGWHLEAWDDHHHLAKVMLESAE